VLLTLRLWSGDGRGWTAEGGCPLEGSTSLTTRPSKELVHGSDELLVGWREIAVSLIDRGSECNRLVT
jgi:hypothetical protein